MELLIGSLLVYDVISLTMDPSSSVLKIDLAHVLSTLSTYPYNFLTGVAVFGTVVFVVRRSVYVFDMADCSIKGVWLEQLQNPEL